MPLTLTHLRSFISSEDGWLPNEVGIYYAGFFACAVVPTVALPGSNLNIRLDDVVRSLAALLT